MKSMDMGVNPFVPLGWEKPKTGYPQPRGFHTGGDSEHTRLLSNCLQYFNTSSKLINTFGYNAWPNDFLIQMILGS